MRQGKTGVNCTVNVHRTNNLQPKESSSAAIFLESKNIVQTSFGIVNSRR